MSQLNIRYIIVTLCLFHNGKSSSNVEAASDTPAMSKTEEVSQFDTSLLNT
eukprot:CAMPEP_0201608524 /NCGR_PEP_ID=MMETSP0492-20130828/7653_1 /ASSEMBLY_ACC=CAM_ASM_000837 /TAXON_ID=420259 /ORGANISM="Thalassiosira gravida, Strain GMp14c1" /LENGTH=50 /DNA_ID=CAMNT_0048073347 /DNA_START=144 /DNA_END=293 /DNA_ORIENTATION=-